MHTPSRLGDALSQVGSMSEHGGTDGGFDNDLCSRNDDGAVLTVGIFRKEMNTCFDRFSRRVTMYMNAKMSFEFYKRDEYMDLMADTLNTHTQDLVELKSRVGTIEQETKQSQVKTGEKQAPSNVRDNIILVDGVAEGEKSRGELTDKLMEIFNKYFTMLKPMRDGEILNVERMGRIRAGEKARPH